jgi:hypothetical protein
VILGDASRAAAFGRHAAGTLTTPSRHSRVEAGAPARRPRRCGEGRAINAPPQPETKGLFHEELIGKSRRGAYLVSTARGLLRRDAVVSTVRKDLQMQAFSEAAEGIRTLDLLHGEQNVRFPVGGLVVIGAHSPEFPFEHDVEKVQPALDAMGIEYPIAIDNDFAIWSAFRTTCGPRSTSLMPS